MNSVAVKALNYIPNLLPLNILHRKQVTAIIWFFTLQRACYVIPTFKESFRGWQGIVNTYTCFCVQKRIQNLIWLKTEKRYLHHLYKHPKRTEIYIICRWQFFQIIASYCLKVRYIIKIWKRSALFCDITQSRVVLLYRRFGTTYRSHLEGSRNPKQSFLVGLLDPWRWDRYVVPKRQ